MYFIGRHPRASSSAAAAAAVAAASGGGPLKLKAGPHRLNKQAIILYIQKAEDASQYSNLVRR